MPCYDVADYDGPSRADEWRMRRREALACPREDGAPCGECARCEGEDDAEGGEE
jgi:hypothetical protein